MSDTDRVRARCGCGQSLYVSTITARLACPISCGSEPTWTEATTCATQEGLTLWVDQHMRVWLYPSKILEEA